MTTNTQKIYPQMTIAEIFSRFPQKSQKLAQAMTQAGLHCVGCHAATWETLEAGMLGHGMSFESIEALVNELNAILEETLDTNTITLTALAAKKFKEFAQEEGSANAALRFSIGVGGCSGYEYILDFSNQAAADDAVFTSEGVEIHVKKEILPKLIGSVIDYVDGLRGAGFKITNPNVKSSCGCGESQGF